MKGDTATGAVGRPGGPGGGATALVALLCAGHFLAFFDRFLFAAGAPLVARAFALDDVTLGLLLGPAFALVYGVAAVAGAVLPHGRARGTVLRAGVTIWTAGSIGIGLAPTVAALAVARGAVGIGQALFVPVALTLLVEATPPTRRGQALSWFTSGSTLGRGLALLAGGGLLALLGLWSGGRADWRMLYVLSAIPNLMLLVALRAVAPADTVSSVDGPGARALRAWIAAHASLGLGIALAGVASVAAAQAVAGWLPVVMVRSHAASAASAAAMIGAVTLATSPAGQLLGGLLVDRIAACRRQPTMLVALALAATLPCLAAVAAAGTTGATLAAIALANVALGVATFASLFAMQAACPPALRRTGSAAFLALVTMFGVGIGPALTGIAAGLRAGAGIEGALVLTVALCGGAALAGAVAVRIAAREGIGTMA